MTKRQYAVRIGLDGKAEIQRDMADIAKTGDAEFAHLGKAIDQGTSAIDRQKRAFDNLSNTQKREQIASANQTAFNHVLGVHGAAPGAAAASAKAIENAYAQRARTLGASLTQAFKTSGAQMAVFGAEVTAAAQAQDRMTRRAAALREQIDPLSAATTRYNSAVGEANALATAGAISEAERVAAVAKADAAFNEAKKTLKGFAAMEAFGSTQGMALTAAMRHMFDAMVSGRPAAQALTMEAGNLSYGLSGSGGLMSAVKVIGRGIGTFLISSLGIAATSFVVFGGAAALGLGRAAAAERELTQATSFAGRAVGATKAELEALAESTAMTERISVNAARELEAAYGSTGKVGVGQLKDLIALTDEFYRRTDHSMSEARSILIAAFSDPAKAGEKLIAQMGRLDDRTRQLISGYMAEGDVADAQIVLQKSLKAALKEATDQTTWYGDAWASVERFFSGAVEAMSKPFKTPTLTSAKTALEQELALARRGQGLTSYNPETHRPQGHANAPRPISQILGDIKRVDDALAAADKNAKNGAADAAATNLSLVVGPYARTALAGYETLQKLKEAQKSVADLGKTDSNGTFHANEKLLSKLNITTQQAKTVQDEYNRAVESYLPPAKKKAQLDALDLEALHAKTPAQKRAIAEKRTEIELGGKLLTQTEASAEVHRAGARAYATAAHAIGDETSAMLALADAYLKGSAAGAKAEDGGKRLDRQIGHLAVSAARSVAQLRDETTARKKLNDQITAGTLTSAQAAEQFQTEREIAPLLIAWSTAEGAAKAKLAEIIKDLTAARANDNHEVHRSFALTQLGEVKQHIALLKQELAIANDGDVQRSIEVAVLEKKQQLIRQNISLQSDEAKNILAATAAGARLNAQLDKATASRAELESMFDNISSSFSQFISSGKVLWNSFKQFGLNVLKDIETELIKLSLINPLKNWLFGTNNPTLGSGGGFFSALSSLFGGGSGGGISPVAVTPMATASTFPGFASGTDSAPGGWSWVGEAGPELVNLPRGSRVLNHGETMNTFRRAANQNAGGGGNYFDLRGAVVTQDIIDQMNAISQRNSVSAVAAGLSHYDQNLDSRIRPVIHESVNDPRLR